MVVQQKAEGRCVKGRNRVGAPSACFSSTVNKTFPIDQLCGNKRKKENKV